MSGAGAVGGDRGTEDRLRSVQADIVVACGSVAATVLLVTPHLEPLPSAVAGLLALVVLPAAAVFRAVRFADAVLAVAASLGVAFCLTIALSTVLLYVEAWSVTHFLTGVCVATTSLSLVSLVRRWSS